MPVLLGDLDDGPDLPDDSQYLVEEVEDLLMVRTRLVENVGEATSGFHGGRPNHFELVLKPFICHRMHHTRCVGVRSRP